MMAISTKKRKTTADHEYAPELPADVLHLIVRRLRSLVCYAAFRSVCTPWRSFFLKHYSYLVPPLPPWHILPASSSRRDPSRPTVYNVYGFNGKQFYQFEFPDDCQMYIGSSGTWLVFIDNKGRKVRVWNPFSLIHIDLPFDEDHKYYNKIIVSCTGPLIKKDEDVIFGVLHDDKYLQCRRLSEKKWVAVETDYSIPSLRCLSTDIHDLVFYKGKLYFVDRSGTVYICEENVHAPRDHDHHYRHPRKVVKHIDPIDITQRQLILTPNARIHWYYLLEVGGELMLVVQLSISSTSLEDDFRVFKLDFDEEKWKFMRKRDLQYWSLFLSKDHPSMAARTAFETGRIYFQFSVKDNRSRSEIYHYKVGVSDYLMPNRPPIIFSEVSKLHSDFIDPTWIIPRHTSC